MKKYLLLTELTFLTFMTAVTTALAQPKFNHPHQLIDGAKSISVTMSGDASAIIHYTTDGSTPTKSSPRYTAPLQLTKTTILRAVEEIGDSLSPVATTPAGYPSEWGSYTQISGTAKADYEMDPEMTGNSTLRPKIIEGLKQLPVLSIVSDKDNFFSHENDEERGGIYIFTGPPVGDATGHGWTRPASVELFGGPQQHDLSTSCGIRLHGGHGRLKKKNQLVLRCHFGNAWQHWGEDNRQRAQYTRDVWARRIQRKMGHTSVNALYVHLFINGMYWGLYNIAERVDGQFGKDHLGGKKEDIDVVKIEEDGGNHIEASEGTLDAWEKMNDVVARAADDIYYQKLDSLLDIGNFIDYMLINQYAGNTDWNHHNWYAIRRHNNDSTASEGFKFLCWDSELILMNVNENVASGAVSRDKEGAVTAIYRNLLQNPQFAKRYVRRAKEVLANDGLLGEKSVVDVWDSLYYTIDKALYDEAARWGDYRRDVHRYSSAGKLYTVDEFYIPERNRLLTEYFPNRSARVLNDILSYVNIDDFEAPEEWIPLTKDMFCEWNGTGADASQTKAWNADWNLNKSLSGGNVVVGSTSVTYNQFADLSQYDRLIVRGSGSGLRIIANRLVDHGPYKQFITDVNERSTYWDSEYGVISIPLEQIAAMDDSNGNKRVDGFVHLNTIKVNSGGQLTVKGMYLVPKSEVTTVNMAKYDHINDNKYYNLNGQVVEHPVKGMYIRNGRKVVIR